jgi:hypothetical protein
VIENLELDDISQIGDILYVVLLLNAIADPIIYTFRLSKRNVCPLLPRAHQQEELDQLLR